MRITHPGSGSADDRGRPSRAPWIGLAAAGLAGAVLAPGGALRPALVLMAAGASCWGVLRAHRADTALRDALNQADAATNEARDLSAVSAASQAVHGLHEMDNLLRITLDEALMLLGASAGSIMLMDSAGYLQTAHVLGNEKARGARMKLGEGVAGQVALTRRPALLEGAPDRQRFPKAVQRDRPLQSAMSAPLVNRDQVLGVINLNAGDDRRFSQGDLDLLCAFAGHAATAIVNAGALHTERARTAELGELNRLKAETMTGVAQDLRGAANALTALLSQLQLGAPVDLETMESLGFSVDRVSRTASQLRSNLSPVAEPERDRTTDLATIARTVVEDFLAQGREVTVDVAGESCHVNCDEDLLRQALWNLLEGAFTFGKPPVTISVARHGAEGVISVADRGLPSNMRTQGGDSIAAGVSMVHGLVSAMGGRVWAENGQDGTAFRIGLPVAGNAPLAAAQREAG